MLYASICARFSQYNTKAQQSQGENEILSFVESSSENSTIVRNDLREKAIDSHGRSVLQSALQKAQANEQLCHDEKKRNKSSLLFNL